jgi:predicted GIY-YIG superfamily endonuclease
MKKTGIYKLEFIDGSYYIGQSLNIGSRLKDHYRMLLDGSHHSYKVQNRYYKENILPKHSIIAECSLEELNLLENSLIDLGDPLCLNIKAGGDNNFGANALATKYHSLDIEMAFLLLVEHPGIPHKDVAEFVGIDINTVHDISAGRSRAFTEMSIKYPEKYAKLLKMKAHNTRGKTTIVLQHEDGRIVKLITGEYSEFCRNNSIQTSNLAKVVTGKRNSTMGWKLIEKYENI